MYTIPDERHSALNGGDLSGGYSPEVVASWTAEDLPEPPDAWQLQDFEDLLPAERA